MSAPLNYVFAAVQRDSITIQIAGRPVPSDEILAHIAPIAFRHI
jgi:hypothetical protein